MNAGTRLAFAAVFFGGLLLSPSLFAGEPMKDIQGELADNDPVDAVLEKPHKLHTVTLEAGKALVVDLQSEDFDAMLRIEDPAGQTVAVDDDSGGKLNSRAVVAATQKGVYKISASSLNGTGKYTLKFRNADALLATRGNLKQATFTYNVKMNPDTSYVINLASKDFDSFLRLEDSNGAKLEEDDDGGFDLNSKITFQPTKADTYKVVVTSFDGDGRGNYDVSVVALPTPKSKVVLTEKGNLQVKSTTHRLKAVAGKQYLIDLTSGDFDTFLRLNGPTGNEIDTDDDGGGGLNSRITFTAEADGVHEIVVTSFDDEGRGNYNLTVRELEAKKK